MRVSMLLLSGVLCMHGILLGQEATKAPSLERGGFVRADAAYDTRLNVESREGFFYFLAEAGKTRPCWAGFECKVGIQHVGHDYPSVCPNP